VASARVSEGERRAVKTIVEYAESKGLTSRIEILGFVDGNRSVDWAKTVGARVINLLTKGSLHHCREQLKKTHEQHLDDIRRTIEYGAKNGITFNVYLEDWSGGMLHSPDYVAEHIDALTHLPVRRIMLPDTLGLLHPAQVRDFVSRIIRRFPGPISISTATTITGWARPIPSRRPSPAPTACTSPSTGWASVPAT
jgi:D-citramalate synthase